MSYIHYWDLRKNADRGVSLFWEDLFMRRHLDTTTFPALSAMPSAISCPAFEAFARYVDGFFCSHVSPQIGGICLSSDGMLQPVGMRE